MVSARLPSLRSREVIQKLLRAGFVLHHQTGSHQYYRDTKGHTVCVPVHPRDLKRGTLASIVKQSGLSREDFLVLR